MSKLTCPECGSDKVTTEYHQMTYVNTGDHYCHSMKAHDKDSPASCTERECDWRGERVDLVEVSDNE